jgi:hypothetical protein
MIHCEWRGCSKKSEYVINWKNEPRPIIIEPFADHNFLCGTHFKKLQHDFPETKQKPIEIYELTDPVIKVTFT